MGRFRCQRVRWKRPDANLTMKGTTAALTQDARRKRAITRRRADAPTRRRADAPSSLLCRLRWVASL
eukprot:152604-Chlamydomonas_euryale.AAC.1